MQHALRHNFRRLASLRLLTCAGIAISLLFLSQGLATRAQLTSAWVVWVFLVGLSVLQLWRAGQHEPSPREFFTYLLLDMGLIISLLYFTGGATNPFITYLLVLIVISAATLSWGHTWLLCLISLSAYGLLLFIHQPLPLLDVQLANVGLNLHIVGMWATFIMSALFIAYFVVDMAMAQQQQAKQLAQLREQSLQNEHLMAIASQAAATAHELGTPLTTMAITLKDLQLDVSADLLPDIKLLQQQIGLCKGKLNNLVASARLSHSEPMPLPTYIHQVLDHWLLMRPQALFQIRQPADAGPQVSYPQLLQQAIINLLDNAMNVSDKALQLELSWLADCWQLSILDNGPGMPEDLPSQAIKPSSQGMGIGMLLSQSSIARLGGEVTWQNLPEGCLCNIKVPVVDANPNSIS
jgi:two-component system, sensor histidine kinase RegB